MHDEILTANQAALLPFIKKYKQKYFLVGGTAIALYIGHRRSIDFDLSPLKKLTARVLKDRLQTLVLNLLSLILYPTRYILFSTK